MTMLRSLLLAIALTAAASAAAADVLRDRLVRELRGDGYEDIMISRTFLGRMRLTAEKGDRRREIIYNPATGVILRDFWRVIEGDGDDGFWSILGPSSRGDDDDDDDDDGDDDDGDDDDGDDDDGDDGGGGSDDDGDDDDD